jgi:hypothetical protein
MVVAKIALQRNIESFILGMIIERLEVLKVDWLGKNRTEVWRDSDIWVIHLEMRYNFSPRGKGCLNESKAKEVEIADVDQVMGAQESQGKPTQPS